MCSHASIFSTSHTVLCLNVTLPNVRAANITVIPYSSFADGTGELGMSSDVKEHFHQEKVSTYRV